MSLTCDELKKIGKDYLENYGKEKGWLHNNQHLAQALIDYADSHRDLDETGCAFALMALLKKLPNLGGLGISVANRLNEYLKENDQVEVNLEEKTVMSTPGATPLDESYQEVWVSRSIDKVIDDFLKNDGLNNLNSDLNDNNKILKIFPNTIKDLVTENNTESLTPEVLKRLGQWYLTEFGKSAGFMHTNQALAQGLVNFGSKDPKPSNDECYLCLLYVLDKVPNTKGHLVKETVDLLNKVLGTQVETCRRIPTYSISSPWSAPLITDKLPNVLAYDFLVIIKNNTSLQNHVCFKNLINVNQINNDNITQSFSQTSVETTNTSENITKFPFLDCNFSDKSVPESTLSHQ